MGRPILAGLSGRYIRNLLDEGVNVIILLADWHAWVNDKFGRDMGKISIAAEYMSEMFRAILDNPGEGPDRAKSNFSRIRCHGLREVLGESTEMLKNMSLSG